MNVIEQVSNVCRTSILRRAWERGQQVEVHGLVYGLRDGLLRPVGVSVNGAQDGKDRYLQSLAALCLP